ncbi:hypothetical protein [Pseudophaeobacter flagellatus]|uniref:hypothetical protein n=1 Tax=Pseudophaeobacter flagellatus TaxID=2899119 RepID=UPI001E457DFF|nr:hypothetical protein [Pseudophaeobacter flagellatus]MCD9148250.1 hypothetical protein [Pseudophaeobacter flagellatus]
MAGHRDIKLLALGLAALLLSACTEYEVSPVPLPSDYALMPGDATLWETLSQDEQRRALAYLSDGSTIRSSLVEDY